MSILIAETGVQPGELAVIVDGARFADIWHSDQGEWTLDLIDGRTFKRNTSGEACDLVSAIVLAERQGVTL